MVKLLGALIALLLAVPAVGQSLSMVDLTRVFHMSPDDLPEFMRGKGWNGNTTVIDGDAFDMGWQYNNVEDIVVKKSADGSKFVSYRLHRQEDIDAYRANKINFDRFEQLPSNKKNVEIYRHKFILQMLTTDRKSVV